MESVRKNAVGVKFDVYVYELDANNVRQAVDLTTLTAKNYVFTKPDGSQITEAAGFKNTGSDGWLRFTNSVGHVDLNQSGIWLLDVEVTFAGGYDGRILTSATFRVKP